MCEQTFSHIKKIKSPYRSRLTDDYFHVVRAATTNFNVEIEKIINNIQQQKSHLAFYQTVVISIFLYYNYIIKNYNVYIYYFKVLNSYYFFN